MRQIITISADIRRAADQVKILIGIIRIDQRQCSRKVFRSAVVIKSNAVSTAAVSDL